MVEPSLAYANVSSRDCAIAFGIPTSRERFLASAEAGTSNLVAARCRDWAAYRYFFIDALEETIPAVIKYGVTVDLAATYTHFAQLFETHRVVVLFSHWTRDSVEFAEGMKGILEVVEGVPRDFNGVLDLCVCHPLALVKELHIARPQCLKKYVNQTVRPAYWLYFYKLVFEIITKRRLTSYLDALKTATLGLRGVLAE